MIVFLIVLYLEYDWNIRQIFYKYLIFLYHIDIGLESEAKFQSLMSQANEVKKMIFIAGACGFTIASSYAFTKFDILQKRPSLISLEPKNRFDLFNDEIRSKLGVAVITGATDGIGKNALMSLAKQGWPKIAILCRNLAKGNHIQQRIKKMTSGKCEVNLYHVDFEDFDSIDKFVNNFNEPVSLLICCAGQRNGIQARTAIVQRIESHLAINYMSHFKLTTKLLPNLLKTASESGLESRIIFITNSNSFLKDANNVSFKFGTRICDPNFIRKDSYDPTLAYNRAEYAKLSFLRYAAKILSFVPPNELRMILVDPGQTLTRTYNDEEISIWKRIYRIASMNRFRCSSVDDAGNLVKIASLDPMDEFKANNAICVFRKTMEPLIDKFYRASDEYQDHQLWLMSQKWTESWWNEFIRTDNRYNTVTKNYN